MKKILYLLITAMLTGCAQKATVSEESTQIVRLDVESLNGDIDLNMDISQLPLSDLRILENVFLAQKGYPFEDSYIRGIYQTTTWYDSLMWTFDATEELFDETKYNYELNQSYRMTYYASIKPEALKLSSEQQAFIDRIRQREAELQALNFKPEGEALVNMGNVVNPDLMKDIDPQLWNHLGQNGFAIVPAKHQQLFQVYEQNDYHEFPSFVTTDLYLQLYHLYFDCMLREVEEHRLDSLTSLLCKKGYQYFRNHPDDQWLSDYFAIALILDGKAALINSDDARQEVERVIESTDGMSEYLGYTEAKFAYSLFKPRGHYTRNERLQRYFRMMMWLQTVPFRTDDDAQLRRALTLANWLNTDTRAMQLYKQITEPMTYLMGQPDNVSITQVADIVKASGLGLKHLLGDAEKMQAVRQQVEQLAKAQTRIKPKFNYSGEYKINLMPQRYQPDAEVLQEMVDYKNSPTDRDVPKGLDVLAAMGCTPAERILIDEINEPARWEQYAPTLQRMKQRMDSVDWNENASVLWLDALKTVVDKPQNAPYFMLTPNWDRKSLNTALASWAELKHDAILYAKQPFGAECGGGGPPDPIVNGYVEPNVAFWQKAVDLLKQTKEVLDRYGLLTERIEYVNAGVAEQAQFLLRLSKKELNGEALDDVECDQLEYLGAAFENISLNLLRDEQHELWSWEDIQGPDRNVALVADVYTANADNNPNKSILFEAVGFADEIYVVIEIGGYLHLMRGAVFSYREFQRSINDQRLNDEEWQEYLEQHPRYGVPEWMTPIIVPMDNAPVDNESVFYSSGC